MSPITVHSNNTQPPSLDSAADISSADPYHGDLIQALGSIGLDHDADYAQHCAHQRAATAFPLISSLSRTEQIRYMRLLRGIARALGVAPFGSTAQILANVHQAARTHSIDTPGSYPGHDTDMADRWLPDMSELTDMALQINMRRGGHTVSRHMSPIRSAAVTPPGGPSRSGRPQVPDASGKRDGHPSCATPGCPCTSTYSGEPGEACCRTCRQGTPCASNYHPNPIGRRPLGRRVPDHTDTSVTYPHCVSPGCPCTSTFNGEPGQPCCRTCRDGTPCIANFHTRPFPGADGATTLPQPQVPLSTGYSQLQPTGVGQRNRHGSQQTIIDLSHDADETSDDGDLYDHLSEFSPPYAQHDIAVLQCQSPALPDPGRTSVAHIVLATVVVYVTWITMQVIQRTFERYFS